MRPREVAVRSNRKTSQILPSPIHAAPSQTRTRIDFKVFADQYAKLHVRARALEQPAPICAIEPSINLAEGFEKIIIAPHTKALLDGAKIGYIEIFQLPRVQVHRVLIRPRRSVPDQPSLSVPG